MNTQKLRDALIEMKHQRALLENAISNIEGVLATLGGEATMEAVPSTSNPKVRNYDGGSYIDLSVKLLEEAGRPMHVADLAKKISELRHTTVPRGSVESSIIRHIKIYSERSRIVKVRPAYFALPIWSNTKLSLLDPARQHIA